MRPPLRSSVNRDHFDVLIVGAGLSGIGAALPPPGELPGQDLRDPRGARRDRRHLGPVPLSGHPLGLGHVHARLLVPAVDGRQGDRRRPVDPRATSARRRASTASTARIRFGHRVGARRVVDARTRAGRSTAERTDTGDAVRLTCGFLFMCSGYYHYDEGYTPEFAGRRALRRPIVHPQHWPEDLDYAGKRVVVIGSGATAVTLVPAMAEQAAHVTMLQRSPSYIVSLPASDPIAQPRPPRPARARLPTRSCAGRTSCSRWLSSSSAARRRGS